MEVLFLRVQGIGYRSKTIIKPAGDMSGGLVYHIVESLLPLPEPGRGQGWGRTEVTNLELLLITDH
jgi:hypothetical protein